MIRLGLSLMPEPQFAAAALPLFEDGAVTAVEWSFDMGWGSHGIPEWLEELIDFYSGQDWLLGHGVSYSLMGGAGRHQAWLDRLKAETSRRSYRWITEHVGFVGAGRFTFAAPMPMPISDDVIELVIYRLAAMAGAAGVPVGIENLATCLSPSDAKHQGALCTAVLGAVDGIQLLDLHNLWCQSINTGVALEHLVSALPLHRVREIHVAGGRTSQGSTTGRTLRRDTHDQLVDPQLLELLPGVAARCPNLEVVVYERLGTSLSDPRDHAAYRNDVRRVGAVVSALDCTAGPLQPPSSSAVPKPDCTSLQFYQSELLALLGSGAELDTVSDLVGAELVGDAEYELDPDLLMVATELVQSWGRLRE